MEEPRAEEAMLLRREGLGKEVCRLLCARQVMQGELFVIDLLSRVMQLDCNVLAVP